MDKKIKPKKKQSPLNWALWMLGRREYSEYELRTKMLQKKQWDEDEINETLEKLKENDFQDDERTAKSMVRTGVSQGKGPKYITQKMRMRGISSEHISNEMEKEDVDWYEVAKDLIQRKYGEGPYEKNEQIKIAGLLIRRGFNYDIAWKLARNEGENFKS